MQPDEIKQWLRGKKEIEIYESREASGMDIGIILKRLAATRELSERRRVLLEKHQWCVMGRLCPECEHYDGHAPSCAWDAALKDVGE